MSDYEGDPINLEVCENCPNRVSRDSNVVTTEGLSASGMGKACVGINEYGLVAAYVSSDGSSSGVMREHSTPMALANMSIETPFRRCEGPLKTGILQKLGLVRPECPALVDLLGDPNSADSLENFIQELQENRF